MVVNKWRPQRPLLFVILEEENASKDGDVSIS